MGTPMTPYLVAIREACRAAMAVIGASTERRGVELACQILNRLIAESKSLAELESAAGRAYEGVLAQALIDRAATTGFSDLRAVVQQALRDGERIPARAKAQIVAIERDHFSGIEQAFRAEVSQPAQQDHAQVASDPASDSDALGQFLSRVFGREVVVTGTDTMALGYSKATLLVNLAQGRDLPQTLVIRMDRPFNYLGTTVRDEFPVLEVLHRAGLPVARPYAIEATGEVLGQPFMVTDRVFGRNVGSHFNFPAPNPELSVVMATCLARIHSVPAEQFGQSLKGSNQTPREQLVADLDKEYQSWSELGAVSPIMEGAFCWLREHTDDAVGPRTLVHGDFSLSNLLIDEQGEISAVLDWEFAKLGNPASDLGWFHAAATRLDSWEAFLEAYRKAGATLPDRKALDYFVLLGALRLAIMNYQVACGFESGRSSDLKHAFAASVMMREFVLRVAARLSELLEREAQATR
jgi:aminoglycoside phosphotransferase (APT) family kinase protein